MKNNVWRPVCCSVVRLEAAEALQCMKVDLGSATNNRVHEGIKIKGLI